MTRRPATRAALALLVLICASACTDTTDGKVTRAASGGASASTAGASGGSSDPAATSASTPTASGSGGSASAETSAASCTYVRGGPAARAVSLPPASPVAATKLELSISLAGKVGPPVTIALTPQATPCTVNSIAHLAQAKYYDNTRCHRLTTSGIYVLQCGDPSATGTGGPGYTFADELTGTETYPAGTVAMANSGANTNGSQFFLVYQDSQLGPDYTVFGRITSGLDVVTGIAAEGTAQPAGDGSPKFPVVITRAAAS